MNSRTRWIIGFLLALVIGLAVGLIIVAGDDSDDSTTVTVQSTTEPTNSETIETSETSGGTPAPGPEDAGGSGSGL